MNLLLMNLSHYWRRPALILLQLLCLCMLLPLVVASQNLNLWTPCLCGIAMIGGIIYGYQMEILTKPFSFTLPSHRRIFRRLIFTIKAFWLLFGAILILLFWQQDMLHRVFGSILTITGGSLAFRLGIGWADKTRQPQALIGMVVPVIVFGSMLADSATIEKILFNPIVVVIIAAAGGIVTFRMWQKLGQLSLFQSYCGLQSVGVFSASNQKNLQKLKRQQFAISLGAGAEDFLSGVETFFLNRIEHTRHKPVASFVYGAIYQGLGPGMLCQLRSKGWSVIGMFALFLFFGYYGKFGDYFIWFIFLFPILGDDFHVHSTLLLTRGRTQRYITAMSWLLFTTIKTLGIVFIYLGLTKIVEPYMPAINLRGLNAVFHAPDWRMWYLFAAGVPLMALLRLLFWNKTIWYLFFFVAAMAICSFSFGADLWHRQIPWGWIVLITVGMWAVFAAYLYRVCFIKSLTTQK